MNIQVEALKNTQTEWWFEGNPLEAIFVENPTTCIPVGSRCIISGWKSHFLRGLAISKSLITTSSTFLFRGGKTPGFRTGFDGMGNQARPMAKLLVDV